MTIGFDHLLILSPVVLWYRLSLLCSRSAGRTHSAGVGHGGGSAAGAIVLTLSVCGDNGQGKTQRHEKAPKKDGHFGFTWGLRNSVGEQRRQERATSVPVSWNCFYGWLDAMPAA